MDADDVDEDEDDGEDEDEDADMNMDMDGNMNVDLASMAASLGMDAETMRSAFLQYMLQQMLNGEGEGDEDDLEQDGDLDDDAKVMSRIDNRFKIPPNFSMEKLQKPCGYCDKGDRKHARNLCCGSFRGEKHTGVLEFMSWDFDPFLAARTKPIKAKAQNMKVSDVSDNLGGAGEGGDATANQDQDEDDEDGSVDGSDDADDYDEKMTWGGILESEVKWTKENMVDKEWDFDYRKVFTSWDNAFRWTCCGVQYGSGLYGCDNHGARGYCSCDYCRSGRKYKPKATQANRFLKFNGLYNYTDWEVVRGVPWSTAWHKHFPREFHEIVKTLLLCRVSAATSGASGL
eukprot:gene22676-25687_t